MTTPYRPSLERLRYWQGQGLRSVDARDQQRFDALRRRLHHRALHGADGVAFGLAVHGVAGTPGMIEVTCGVAFNGRGEELILQRARRIGLPAVPGTQVLRIGLRAAAPAPGAHLLDEETEVGWVSPAGFRAGRDVQLARCKDGTLDADYRPRLARALARPRLATGATVPGNTPWEPWVVARLDANGTVVDRVVGVQTYIDTAASGFTLTPRYVASLQTLLPAWDQDSAEFAPAFFAHVSDASPEGFTFRLLMSEIARRRYKAWNGIGRVGAIARGDGERLKITVDAQAAFKTGDVVAQLRPRASTVVALTAIDGDELTLAPALDAGTTCLAVGNLPRTALVTALEAIDPAVVAAYASEPAAQADDALWRTADGAVARINAVAPGTLTVGLPFDAWRTADPLVLLRLSVGVGARATADATDDKLVLKLSRVKHGVEPGMAIALLDAGKLPLAMAAVTSVDGTVIVVQPALAADQRKLVANLAPTTGVTIASLQRQSASTIVLASVAGFAQDDYVIVADQPAQVARVTGLDAATRRMHLSDALDAKPGARIVGINWLGATSIDLLDPALPNQVTVGRHSVAVAGDVVARQAGGAFLAPVLLTAVADRTLTLARPLAGAARLDVLAVGRFPRSATVIAQDAAGTGVTIAEAGALQPGDCVVLAPSNGAGNGARTVLQVVSIAGGAVTLSGSPGPVLAGDQLLTVHWRELVHVEAADPRQPARLQVDSAARLRAGDVVGAFVHHADCSNAGFVESINGNVLTLLPGLAYGDGIVPGGWIDGGVVGPAAVCLPAIPPPAFPQWQPLVRLETVDGIAVGTPATAYGFDLSTGTYQSRSVLPYVRDDALAQALLYVHGAGTYRFRPETLSLITGFNDDFPRAFVNFAQAQQLVVRWIGCQDAPAVERACPAQAPYDPCASAAPAPLSKDA